MEAIYVINIYRNSAGWRPCETEGFLLVLIVVKHKNVQLFLFAVKVGFSTEG